MEGTGDAAASKCTVRTHRSCRLPQLTTQLSLGNHLSGLRQHLTRRHLARPAPAHLQTTFAQRLQPHPRTRAGPQARLPAAGPGRAGPALGERPAGHLGRSRAVLTLRGAEGQCPGRDELGAPRGSSRPRLERPQTREPSPEVQQPRAPAGNHSNRRGPRRGRPCHCRPPRVPRRPRPDSEPFPRGRARGGAGSGAHARRAAGRAPSPRPVLTYGPQHPRQATQPAVPPRHALLLCGQRGADGHRRPARAAHGAAIWRSPPPAQRVPQPAASAGALPCGRGGHVLA